MTDKELLCLAKKAQENSYSPYSGFRVGAALLAESGKCYLGVNIENAAYGETICAERCAFLKALSEGERDFIKIAVVGTNNPCYPCGSCRQVMAEFCGGDFEIILENEKIKLKDLLPFGFSMER